MLRERKGRDVGCWTLGEREGAEGRCRGKGELELNKEGIVAGAWVGGKFGSFVDTSVSSSHL